MRILPALLFVVSLALASNACAQYLPGERLASYHTGDYGDAHRALELASHEQRHLQRVEHPIVTRRLRTEIEITEARIKILRERLREYAPYGRFSRGRALSITTQETRMFLLREEQHLRELRLLLAEEQQSYRNYQWALAIEAQRAADCLARETAARPPQGTIEIVTHEEVVSEENND